VIPGALRAGPGPGAAVLAAILLAACRPIVPIAQTTPTPTEVGALATADQELWTGHWTAAERDYRKLLIAGNARAGSHLALLLVYEDRFVEAVSDARAAVQQSPDSDSYARLTRALDWSNEIPAAIAAGAQAVAATPVDPLAYDFYAEALADGGRFSEAEAQLRLAQSAARTPNERAETQREWSNYYRDRNRDSDAFNYVELAQASQPGFPERALELAAEYFADGAARRTDARALLDRFLKEPGDPAVLALAGDSAFAGGDAADSERFYRAALGVAPGDPAASLGLAELEMATKKDAQAARTVLLAALQRHPDAEAVAEYLRQLDALVLHAHDSIAAASAARDSERQSAYDSVNAGRQAVGLPGLKPDASLAAAAEAHAYYVLFNWGSPGLAGLGVHSEDQALPGFTGQNSAERDRHFGYPGFQSAEVLNHTFTASAAVEVWVDSVYHRLPLLGRESTGFGYGEAQVGSLAVNVMDFGVGVAQSAEPVVYPYQDQTGVPAGFVGNEVPDPAPNARYPVGYPITVAAGGADTLTIAGATVTPTGGSAVSVILDKPGLLDLDPNEAAILPAAPLVPGLVYTVKVRGLLDGRPWSDSWTFQVES